MDFGDYLICINLKKLKTIDDIKDILNHFEIDDLYSRELMEYKQDGYLKLYLDKKTHNLVAFTHKDDKKFIELTDEWLRFLRHIEPLELPKKEITVDEVLDKISESGLDSLTKEELKILKKR